MRSYDPELLAALAEGTLDPELTAALEAEIAADPRAALELAAQRTALRAIRTAPPPVLAADERAELRSAVAAALNLEVEPASAALTTRRRVPWAPLAVAAAALAGIIAAVPLIGLLQVGGGDGADATLAVEVPTTTDAYQVAGSNGSEDAYLEAAPVSTTAPGSLGLGTATPPVGAGDRTRQAEEATNAIADYLAAPGSLLAAADPELDLCFDEARALVGDRLAPPRAATVTFGGFQAVAWFSADTAGTTLDLLLLFDPADCALLGSHP